MIDSQDQAKIDITVAAIERSMLEFPACVQMFSAGKDSSALLSLSLTAAARLASQGKPARVHLMHVDTGVENPQIVALARSEIAKAQAWAERHGVEFEATIVEPSTWYTWPARVIGGRGLPTFPGSRRDCQTELKRQPLEAAQKAYAQYVAANGLGEPCAMTGVRRDESVVRSAGIDRRGETSQSAWRDKSGHARLTPLLDWTADDVWAYLGYASAGLIDAYSDFEETMQVYRDAGASSCMVVADMAMQANSKPCSTRFGCWSCTAVEQDRSMMQMIDSDPANYARLRPLAQLRDFMIATQYDWSRRTHVGRSIKDGFITIAADGYSPNMLQEMLRYTLTAQALSGVPIIDETHLLAIDARWSLYAIAKPFTALRIWRQWQAGARWPIPVVAPVRKTAVPAYGRIYVGQGWDEDDNELAANGLRDPLLEAFGQSCGVSLRTTTAGRIVIDYNAPDEAGIDPEAAMLFMDFEADDCLREADSYARGYWTSAYMKYLSLGVVQLGPAAQARNDTIMRRTQWRQRHDLHGQRGIAELVARLTDRSVRQPDMFETELFDARNRPASTDPLLRAA